MKMRRRPANKIQGKAIAKVEAVAKVSYKRSKITTEVIPPDVSRAKAGAWLTLISPITEWAGLKGDMLRHKRELLRIQQETALQKIVEDAMKRLPEHETAAPLPNKFLVPFLERASLEDGDEKLSKMWSDLLISAATNYNPSMVRFTSVLSEIGPGEAALLKRLVAESRSTRGLNHLEDVPNVFVYGILQRMMAIEVPTCQSPEDLHRLMLKNLSILGRLGHSLAFGHGMECSMTLKVNGS